MSSVQAAARHRSWEMPAFWFCLYHGLHFTLSPKPEFMFIQTQKSPETPILDGSQVSASLDTPTIQTPKHYLSNSCPTPIFFLLSRGLDAHFRGFRPQGLCISTASSGKSFLDSACIWPLSIEVLAQLTQASSDHCPWELFTALTCLNLSCVSAHWSRYRGPLLLEHKPLESRGLCPLSVTVPFNGAKETHQI